MNSLHSFPGTKICEKCLNHAVTSYVFIHQTLYVRNRLNTCISLMLDNLKLNPETNVFIEISKNAIMPLVEPNFDENILLNDEEIDESKLKIDVLEDEFRQDSESEESAVSETDSKETKGFNIFDELPATLKVDENPSVVSKSVIEKSKKLNGVNENKYNSFDDVCSEFLTFKKRKKPARKLCSKFTCPLCNKYFLSEYFLKRHILKHMFKKINCIQCGNQFKSKFYLYEHTKMIHLQNNYHFFSCKTCGRTFETQYKLDRHVKSHINKECHLCEKKFLTQKHYDTHMQRHATKFRMLQKQPQTCSFCEKECANDNDLSVHVNKVHLQIKPYSCDMCERQFYTESNLSNHKKVHSLLSKEQCEFCTKTMKCRRDLVVHVRKHIGVQPFSCPVCEKSFYSSTKVKNHMKTSHGGKFCCKLCKIVVLTKFGLKEHINRVHNMI